MFRLCCEEDGGPGLIGFGYWVEPSGHFSLSAYADTYGIHAGAFDAQSVKAVQNAATQLSPGAWLRVWHEAAHD